MTGKIGALRYGARKISAGSSGLNSRVSYGKQQGRREERAISRESSGSR